MLAIEALVYPLGCAPMLGNRSHLELANSLAFALPGTPVIRYGDEIGMGG